jgi:uncharacterized protein YybS (DUF2232 family)
MGGSSDLGRFLVVVGLVIVVVGLLITFGPRVPWLGRLPGDVVYRKGNFTLYFPIVTSILLSVLLSLLLSVLRR